MWTRRALLKAGGVALFSIGAGPSFLAQAAAASTSRGPRRKVLVAIFQRGAMDALAAVPPLDADAALRSLRPRLALGASRSLGESNERLIELASNAEAARFGLHPALAPLAPLYREKQLAIVHAVGSPDATRSHFDAQDYLETGTPGNKGTDSGWLNRAVGLARKSAANDSGGPLSAVALTPLLPRALSGPAPAVAVADLADFALTPSRALPTSGDGFEALYAQTTERLLRSTAAETFDALERIAAAKLATARPAVGADYPRTKLGAALQQIASLIKADLGLEVAFAESTGWDTHAQQGSTRGGFARAADDLAQSIAAFWHDLGAAREHVVLSTMTEFGRTVRENGSGGTDHGHGSCLFVLGTGVDGGKVHGRFPGLEPAALYEGRDLAITTDFRAVFSELATHHLGVSDSAALFPDWTGARLPLFRGV